MSLEDKAVRTLEQLADALNRRDPLGRLRAARSKLQKGLEDAGVRVLDQVVGRIAGREVDTRPRLLDFARQLPGLRRRSDPPALAADPTRPEPSPAARAPEPRAAVEPPPAARAPEPRAPAVEPPAAARPSEPRAPAVEPPASVAPSTPASPAASSELVESAAEGGKRPRRRRRRRRAEGAEPGREARAGEATEAAESAPVAPAAASVEASESAPESAAPFEAPESPESAAPVEAPESPESAAPVDPAPESAAPVDRASERPDRPAEVAFAIDRLVLVPRGPDLAFAYWEIAPARLAALADPPPVEAELRVVDEASGEVVHRTTVDPHTGRIYVPLPHAGRAYIAELSAPTGQVLSRSRPIVATDEAARARIDELVRPF